MRDDEIWFVLVSEWAGSIMYLFFVGSVMSMVKTYDRRAAEYMQRVQMWKVGEGGWHEDVLGGCLHGRPGASHPACWACAAATHDMARFDLEC